MADSSAKKAMPRFAIASTHIRRDLIAPLRYFTRLEIAHLYRRAPYHDLVTEDWDANLIAYGSQLNSTASCGDYRPMSFKEWSPSLSGSFLICMPRT